ncbi:MBL fold metallo-hydrolase [Micromonospora krabiensis]|uniref:Glyoxylase, beta-lactamase superfamily II n=1 Tax=Micromonospora krabiensis TaxID=307121 RepID=A0A1C3NAA9_9ACTN|nr:MBL fold metallo-hydrolase [Micromonospora krabiensis]SBV29527.1 Glyoxylase, beta-lactamase superfamily II [Micromonospora krabiensis]
MEYAVHSVRRPGVTRDLPFGPDDLRWVANTATLVYGERDAVLVDTYTTVEQNQALVDWVRSFGRRLTHVYITHAHGDHLFGVGQIIDAFPGVRAVATKETVAGSAAQVGPEWVDSYWELLFPGQIPQHLPVPETLDGDTIELEGHRLEAIGTGATDTAGSSVLWVPDLRLLVAGDVVYNDAHQYLAESTTETRAHWAATVDRLRELDPVAVVAGHKNPDRADDPVILTETATYLRDFDEVAARTTTAEELYAAMLERYPRRVNPGSLWGGAKKAKPAS